MVNWTTSSTPISKAGPLFKALLVLLVVALFFSAVALIGTYTFLPPLLENLVARSLQGGLGLAEVPEVDLKSDSPPGMLAGKFEEGRMTLTNSELIGGLRPDEVAIELEPFDLDVLGSVASGRLRSEEPLSGTLSAEFSEEEIKRIAESEVEDFPVLDVELREGRMLVGFEVEALGLSLPVSVEGSPEVRNGAFRFVPRRVEVLGERMPERLARDLLAGTEFAHPLGELPFEGETSGLKVYEDRLVFTGEVSNLPVG